MRDRNHKGRSHFKKSADNQHNKKADTKRTNRPDAPLRFLTLATRTRQGWLGRPISRKQKFSVILDNAAAFDLTPDDLLRVEIKTAPGRMLHGPPHAKIIDYLGAADADKAFSNLAAAQHEIPEIFSKEALAEAAAAIPTELGTREDLRSLPLVTIDGADARDFDDAVYSAPDAEQKDCLYLIVAIADVAHYVRPQTALDITAIERGNSVYFPDRVIPMLPEALSNDLCSLRPHTDKACLAAHLWIDEQGQITRWRFSRALMRSRARLTYEQVQNAKESGETPEGLPQNLLPNLYAVFKRLLAARMERGTLELDVPERKVELDAHGQVRGIKMRERLDSHRLIEECMIAANIAAAKALQKKQRATLYRIHDLPPPERLELLTDFLQGLGYKLPKGQAPSAESLSRILAHFSGKPELPLVSEMLLRSQSQAAYSPDNIGHFGLALTDYAHFTSPIRRYADLVVHRALIEAYQLGEGGIRHAAEDLGELGEHLGLCERRAAMAERDTVERYLTRHLADKVDAEFNGRISGVQSYGLFVRLEETGAEGLLPVRRLPGDFYIHDEKRQSLSGRRNGLNFRLYDSIRVRLAEADVMTGSLSFDWVGDLPKSQKPAHHLKDKNRKKGKEGKRPKNRADKRQKASE